MKKLLAAYASINETIAVFATKYMGTMGMVYFFAILSVAPFFFPNDKDLIAYVSSSMIQLIALPLIMVGQAVLSRASEARAQQDHETLMDQHADIHEQLRIMRALIEQQREQNTAIEDLIVVVETRTCRSCASTPSTDDDKGSLH